MRFLILSTNYPIDAASATMESELAAELIRTGHEVDVLVLAWHRPTIKRYTFARTAEGANVHVVPVHRSRAFGRFGELVARWLITPLTAGKIFRRHLETSRYDVVLAWTPCVLMRSALKRVLATNKPRSVLYIADFFPIHHAEVGLVPRGPIYRWAKNLEEAAIKKFDVIFCNLPSNIQYLREHYDVRPEQDIRWTPLWTGNAPLAPPDKAAIRRHYNLPPDRPVAVFGGHIIEGRGIEQMLGAAACAREEKSNLHFVFIGNGRLAPQVQQAARLPGSNVTHIPALSREAYLSILTASDIGMLATVPNVSSHSFPTKSMDYLRAGLPFVASVEPDSDFEKLMLEGDVGVFVTLGDSQAFYEALKSLLSRSAAETQENRAKSTRILEDVLDVSHCYRRLIEALASTDVGTHDVKRSAPEAGML